MALAFYVSTPVWAEDCEQVLTVAEDLARNSDFYQGNPYILPINLSQGAFLKSLGADLLEERVLIKNVESMARKYNEIMDGLILSQQVQKEDAVFWSQVFVGQDGKLIFARLETSAPLNALPFEPKKFRISGLDNHGRSIYVLATDENKNLTVAGGILSETDYFFAVANGYFPGTFSEERIGINSRHGVVGEPAYLHEFGHLGGFVDIPEGMKAFRQTLRNLRSKLGNFSHALSRRIFYVNETLLILKPNAKSSLRKFMAEFNINPLSFSESDILRSLEKLTSEELYRLYPAVSAWHYKNRLPFGGALRSGTMAKPVENALDKLIIIADIRLRGINLNPAANAREEFRPKFAKYLAMALALADTTVSGWFLAAESDEFLKTTSAYYKYLCEEPGLHDGFSEFFCPPDL